LYVVWVFSPIPPAREAAVSLRIALALALAGMTLGEASAQTAPPPPPAAPGAQAGPRAGVGAKNGRTNANGKVLTDAEKVAKASEHVVKMKAAMKNVLQRVEDARNEKDVVKLNCVNEKLTQVKGLLKVAEQADVALNEAVARKDDAADTEFQKISMARAKIDQLRGEADLCIGQLAYVVSSETTVEVEQPDNLPSLDVTRRQPPPEPVVSPPVVRKPPASKWYP
jgi:hypothetical protein